MFLDFLKDINNYEQRKIARISPEDNNGIGVSTCYSSDEGYETALLCATDRGVIPVERYLTKEEAILGHAKWVEFAKNGNNKKVIKLSWTEFSADLNKEVILKAL